MFYWQSFILIVSLILLTGLNPIQANAQSVEEESQTVKTERTILVNDGELSFIFSEKEYSEVRHILDYFLQQARDNALAKNFDRAAEELKFASFYMVMDARTSDSDLGEEVLAAALETADVAAALEKSKTPISIVDRVILDSHSALAIFHQQRAKTFLDAGFDQSAGYAMEASLTHYRSAAISKSRLEGVPFDSVIDDELYEGVEKFSIAMKEGQPVSEMDASGLLARLNGEIDSLM